MALKAGLNKDTGTNAPISSIHDVLFRDWALLVSETWKMKKCSDNRLSACAGHSKTTLDIGEDHELVLIGEPDEATKLTLKIDDCIEKLINKILLEILSKSYGMCCTSLYGRAM